MTSGNAKALQLIEAEIEAIGFDIHENSRQMVASVERHADLMERRKRAMRLYRMAGGDPGSIAPAPERIGVAG